MAWNIKPDVVQNFVKHFSRQLSNQVDGRVAFSDSILTADFSKCQSPTVFRHFHHERKTLGTSSRSHTLPPSNPFKRPSPRDVPNVELTGYVCYGSKSGFATLLVSDQFCTIKRSWNFEERCAAILFGTAVVMAVYAPDSSRSLEMFEDCISSVFKVLREGRR